MCARGNQHASATAQKATADRPSLPAGRPKKVEYAKGTKREQALKNSQEAMTVETIEVDTFHASEISSNEWLADSGANRHICNDIQMLRNVRQLEVPIIVRQLVGEVTVTKCGTVRIECENETGAVVRIDLYESKMTTLFCLPW